MSYNESLEREFLHNISQQGKVEWIGIRPKRLLEVHSVSAVTANPDTGLEGDHFKKSSTGKRQVTLIQLEHLDVVARILGKSEIPPELLRRNIVVSGINLLALKHQQFQVGEVLLETTGICALQSNGRKTKRWRLQQHAWAWRHYCYDNPRWTDQDWWYCAVGLDVWVTENC